jgi:hypothetical protein
MLDKTINNESNLLLLNDSRNLNVSNKLDGKEDDSEQKRNKNDFLSSKIELEKIKNDHINKIPYSNLNISTVISNFNYYSSGKL